MGNGAEKAGWGQFGMTSARPRTPNVVRQATGNSEILFSCFLLALFVLKERDRYGPVCAFKEWRIHGKGERL